MPTLRWTWIAPVTLLVVACEWAIIFRLFNRAALTRRFGLDALESFWADTQDATQSRAGRLYIWVSLLIGQAAFWGYCLCLLFEQLYKIGLGRIVICVCQLTPGYRLALGGRLVALIIALAVWYGATLKLAPAWTPASCGKMLNIRDPGVLGFATAAVIVCCMWCVEAAVYCHLRPLSPVTPQRIYYFLYLQDLLQRLLLMASALLVLGVLSLDSTRIFVQTCDATCRFPRDLVLIFGGIFSVLLGIAYAAPFKALHDAGTGMRDLILPTLANTDMETIQRWAEARHKLNEVLHLEIGEWGGLAPGIQVIAPLATAVVSHFVGGKRHDGNADEVEGG